MTQITYEIVEHDGGWAYKVGETVSETFPSHAAAAEQETPGETEDIVYEDRDAIWHAEVSPGDDRPDTQVRDVD